MKWVFESAMAAQARMMDWHLVFLWWPRQLKTAGDDDSVTWAWFETVGRRYYYHDGHYGSEHHNYRTAVFCSKEDAMMSHLTK